MSIRGAVSKKNTCFAQVGGLERKPVWRAARLVPFLEQLMPDVDFVMTFPCYFLQTERGNIESVVVNGDTCICLFTDSDILETWYQEKYSANFIPRTADVVKILNIGELRGTLEEIHPQLVAQDVYHLVIDPTPGKLVGQVTIREFLDHVR